MYTRVNKSRNQLAAYLTRILFLTMGPSDDAPMQNKIKSTQNAFVHKTSQLE